MPADSFTSMVPRAFFCDSDVVSLAQKLIGCTLWTRSEAGLSAGMIVETEAYDGLVDRACHAYGGRKTDRTRIFYQPGGVLYTYLCYGIHTLSNIITGPENSPQAILIRAVQPVHGIDLILKRRNHAQVKRNTAAGPGLVSQALGITRKDNGASVCGPRLWLTYPEEHRFYLAEELIASPRVGIGYAGPDALLPWRFRLKGSSWCSPAK
ncbi:DNA-3-methyladenine glycosylase [Balneolaceae bacterium ANBcel3]|nr:DNA-3-methyladenine glycosylase [Balneolaceae bacterium ANBcel3]